MNDSEAGAPAPAQRSDTELALRLIDTVPVPMGYVDSDLVVRICGKAAADVLGLCREEIVGRRLGDVFGPGDVPTEAVLEVLATHEPRRMLLAHTPEGESVQHWEVACVPDLEDGNLIGVVLVGFDVSDLVDAQRRVAESEQMYRSIGELLPFGTWIAEEDGSIAYLSDSFVEMTGQDRDSLLGWGWLNLLPSSEERDRAVAQWHRDTADRSMRDTKHVVRARDGTYRHVLCRGIRLTGGKGPPRWVGIHADITDSERQLQFRYALNNVKDLLVASLETEELLAQVGEAVLGPTSADYAAVIVPHEGKWWQIRYAAGSFPGLEDRWRLPQEEMPLNLLALRSGKIQIAEDAQTDPRMNNERAREDGLRSLAVLPIKRYGASICLLGLAYTSAPIVADRPLLDFFSGLIDSLDLALQTAATHEHQRHIAERLQESLLAVPDRLPHIEMSHLYQAAAEEERVGGDFYDAFKLRSRIAFLVGDISGSGLEAAALTALAKDTLRAHLMDGQTPASALAKTNVVMHAFTEAHEFATVFVATLDPRSRRIHYACAGHPPPLVVGNEGVRAVEGGGPLLGAFEDAHYDDYDDRLGPDETIVLYTDGITEARRDAEMYGQERLSALLGSLGERALGDLLPLVLEDARAFAGKDLDDDVAMLAIRAKPEA